jgi:hypothetical protein
MTALIPVEESPHCAHCGVPCERCAEDNLGYCTLEHLLLARIQEKAHAALSRLAAVNPSEVAPGAAGTSEEA